MARLRLIAGWIGITAAVAVVAAAAAPPLEAIAAERRSAAAPVIATPFGITLQPLGIAQGWGLGKDLAASIPRDEIAYADLDGMTLYTYDGDPAGKATCLAECAKKWLPMPAQGKAAPFGDWSVITRGDGTKQWALKGKPLYRFIEDVTPGSVGGTNVFYTMSRGPLAGHRGAYYGSRMQPPKAPEGWQVALLYPVKDMNLPAGFGIKEVQDAAGLALVDNVGHTLYTLKGDIEQEKASCQAGPCAELWKPLTAPRVGLPKGDFAVKARADGVNQWHYKGNPLYRYARDHKPEVAEGDGMDRPWEVALVAKYYLPNEVMIHKTASQGKTLATKAGLTLYRRDGWLYQSGGGHSFPRGQSARPAVGRDLGTERYCGQQFDSMAAYGDCNVVWQPFLAPENAQASGFWEVATRKDGRKQWVYQGYAMWTFAGDKKPGDINGHDAYDIAVSDDPLVLVDVGTQMDGSSALYWSIAAP
jgi:predicted lipoprotein with Yx(FWY)xxD motif